MLGPHLINESITLIKSIKLLNSLGFIIHQNKSIFLPKQEITILGFNINSQQMEITVTGTTAANFESLLR